MLRFSREAYEEASASGNVDEDGVEAAFEVVTDVNETALTGHWVGDTFFYSNSMNRLNYLVGDKTYTIQTFDQAMYLLGFLPREGRIYVCNKDLAVQSFALSLSVSLHSHQCSQNTTNTLSGGGVPDPYPTRGARSG